MGSNSKSLLKKLPPAEEMHNTITNLMAHGHRAAAMVGMAFLDRALQDVLRRRLRAGLTKKEQGRLFDPAPNGILGSTYSKILIAYATKLLGPNSYHDLSLLNDIRNVFAHSLHILDFGNPHIVKDCENLRCIKYSYAKANKILSPQLAEPQHMFSATVWCIYENLLNINLYDSNCAINLDDLIEPFAHSIGRPAYENSET